MILFNETIITASKSYFNEFGNLNTKKMHKTTLIKFVPERVRKCKMYLASLIWLYFAKLAHKYLEVLLTTLIKQKSDSLCKLYFISN